MPFPVGTRFGAYEIVGLLGIGGMGEVYRARDTKLDRDVALKILGDAVANDPDGLARFTREAKALALLNHPHIAHIHGLEEQGSTRALIMEFVGGEDLAHLLARGPVPIDEALLIARQIAEALEAAHEQGIVHRDLKPANVRRRPDGTVKVLDFGLAKRSAPAPTPGASEAPTFTVDGTQTGVILGTVRYMSPEQARGHPVDTRTDIWAFGCVLYELLVGSPTFAGTTSTDILSAIVSREPEWDRLPPATPPAVKRLLARCLAKDAKQRLHHIADARLELQEAMTSGAALARDERITSRSARLWKLMALSSLAALAAVLVYGSSWMWNRDTAPGERTAGMVATQLTDYGGSESGGALSPDGRSFVFVSDHGGTPDLWMRQVSSSAPIRLTADAVQESNPVFSPDGQTVYYSRGPEGGEEIWRVDAFGGQPRKVFDRARAPVPSPDGGRIAFLTVAPESALVVAALDGSSTRILVRSVPGGDSERPAWSPDGRWLSYARWNLFGPINLWLVEVATGHSRQITRFVGSSDGIGSHAWLPDSRHLVVTYETVY